MLRDFVFVLDNEYFYLFKPVVKFRNKNTTPNPKHDFMVTRVLLQQTWVM